MAKPIDVKQIDKRIILINDDVIIVNKVAGEAMEGAGRGMTDLAALLCETCGMQQVFPPTAVHRLDVPVSGCSLFARNPRALTFLNNCFARKTFEGGRAEKFYWAVVEKSKGFAALSETGEMVHWIQTNKKRNISTAYPVVGGVKKMKIIDYEKENLRRKPAMLRYRIRGEGKSYAYLEIDLVTGRHHQIRAQLAAEGIHIKGDLKYGAARSEREGGIRLHARSLYFPDPSLPGSFIQATADPPFMDSLWRDFCDAF